MWKVILAGVTALTVAGSTMVSAQQPADTGGRHHQHWRPSQADLNAFTDARVAALKAGLELTAEQERTWPAVEQAIRDMAKARQERIAARASKQPAEDLIQRLRDRADAMTNNAANLKKLADAAQPLYQSLNEDQKHRLVFLIHALRPHHRHFREGREHLENESAPQ
jgi:zinc resistance-associated protein